MADGLPPDAARKINAAVPAGTTGPDGLTWHHIHQGEVTLALADPNLDARREHFRAQQRSRAAQAAYGTLRQAQNGTPAERAAALKSVEPLLKASGAAASAPAAARAAGRHVDYDWYTEYLRNEWIPHLMAKVRQAGRDKLTAIYGTGGDPHQDKLLGQLTDTDLAEGRLAAERAHQLGLTEEEYRERMAESKWHNDRLGYLQRERAKVKAIEITGKTKEARDAAQKAKDKRLEELDQQIDEAESNRKRSRTEAEAADARSAAQPSPTDDAYTAGLRYGQELKGLIREMIYSILRSVVDY